MMGVLYDVETHTINYHLKKVFADSKFERYRIIQDHLFESDFDRMIKQLEQKNEDKE